jgi:ABC-type branched-subunit amino acid transport system substrate-binding protein
MWWRLIAATFMALAWVNAVAEETIKVGLILPMTGPFTTTGKQVEAGARFYMQQNGASVMAGKSSSSCVMTRASPTTAGALPRSFWSAAR